MKKIQILIITLVAILTSGCATFAVLYFATDIFKSDKALFYKYASQIDLKEFLDLESYNNYQKRLENEGHGNEGEFTIDLAQGEETINESIKYAGYSDPVNKKSNCEISINKDSEELLAINYLKDEDLYGLQFKDIVNQYIVLENNNLKEFASKIGVENTDNIPDKIEDTKLSEYINYEELKPLVNKYLNTIIEAIPEDNYSKIEKEKISLGDKTLEADGYQIKLKTKDIQSILKKVLESAKNDEQLLKLINKLSNANITFEDYQNYIDEILTDISGEISKEENVDCVAITVYKQGKNTVKLSAVSLIEEDIDLEVSLNKTDNGLMLEYNSKNKINTYFNDEEFDLDGNENSQYAYDTFNTVEESIIKIKKTINSSEQENFEFNIIQKSNEEETGNYNITLSRTGALTSNNVTFSILIPITLEDENINIEFKNTTNFSATPQLEEFIEGNHLVINEVPAEQLNNLFTNLGNKIADKLQNEMFISLIANSANMMENTEINNGNIQDAIEEERLLLEEVEERLDETNEQNGSTIVPNTF